jgi:uncharacterized protein
MASSDAVETPATPRVKTTVPVALGVFIVYVVIFIGLMKASGVDYDDLVDTAGNTWRAVVLPLAGGAVFLALFAWWSGWDHIFTDPRRLSMGFWLWLPPALMVVIALLRFTAVDWNDFSGSHLAGVVVAGILVGFTEETLFRGVILRALRNGVRHEGEIALWTSLWFGFFHATNIITGQSVGSTLQQCVLASLFGIALFLARRARGLLIWGMVLHALWDMSSFLAGTHHHDGGLFLASGALGYPLMILALIALIIVWRRKEVLTEEA